MMKHPTPSTEAFEFNLGHAPQLRCVAGVTTTCGSCECCQLLSQITLVKDWFSKAGDQSRRRFILGLVRRLHSVDLLEYFVNLLSPLLCKDFTYARTRTNPSLKSDRCTVSADRALNTFCLDREITKTWYWFQSANYWTKSNFMLGVLRVCEAHLLYLVGNQARTLLAAERKAFTPEDDLQIDDYESASIASSHFTHDTSQHPELSLLKSTNRCYSTLDSDPFSPDLDSHLDDQEEYPEPSLEVKSRLDVANVIHDESGDEGFDDGASSGGSSEDPTLLVMPTSSKGHAGVSRYKDYIRWLPVHLAKNILGMLDKVSLHNCVCVSKNWRVLVEEVHRESYEKHRLWEDVMLMQGSGSQGCNPVYAKDIDVAVPNLEPDSYSTICSSTDVIEPTFKSEVDFTTAYSGFSTRNIILEERNVYCGAYNVMVLIDGADTSRVIHTDGGKLIALGSQDRRVRFINSETGKETGPVISGHAGSVRCVAIHEKNGFVLSGSYDTSIRCWALETGKCQKIFRGHRDTITCLEICGDKFVSGAKDNLCKVWHLASGKCLHTFKHRFPVVAVTMSEQLCISGCEGGKVKVWDMKSGALIKKLTGHHGPVTGICFDRWHIVTASRDGYALAWSSQGDHKRCLSALRHPKEVLCLEFMYLRVVTGCADGKLRIWNMITGDCLRIMRGNSRSDPITSLLAIGNRVTLNTSNNLLVLNFEPIEYDYTLETDKMPSLVQYSQYSDAPIRQHPYPYIRAQRMDKAGATNTKIVYHDGREPEMTYYRTQKRPEQVAHSAKTLSKKSLERARSIQTATSTRADSAYESMDSAESKRRVAKTEDEGRVSKMKSCVGASVKSVSMTAGKPPQAPSRPTTAKSRATSLKSGTQTMYSVGGFQLGRGEDDSDIIEEDQDDRQRRVSWAFQHPEIPKTKELNLTETKSLLRSQIRAKGDVVPPDFIYLTVNAIQTGMRAAEASKNMEANRREQELERTKKLGRPSSSPSRIDSRTRLPVEELGIEDFMIEQGVAPGGDMQSVAESKISRNTHASKRSRPTESSPVVQTKSTYIRDFNVTPLKPANKDFVSIHRHTLKSSIPKGHVLRPHTAQAVPTHGMAAAMASVEPRSKSAGFSSSSRQLSNSSSVAPVSPRKKKYHGFTTSATEAAIVPMLMYPKDMVSHLTKMKAQRQPSPAALSQPSVDQTKVGAVSDQSNPFRPNVQFQLRTHHQVEQELVNIGKNHVLQKERMKEEQEKRQRQLWLNKVKSQIKQEKEGTRGKLLGKKSGRNG